MLSHLRIPRINIFYYSFNILPGLIYKFYVGYFASVFSSVHRVSVFSNFHCYVTISTNLSRFKTTTLRISLQFCRPEIQVHVWFSGQGLTQRKSACHHSCVLFQQLWIHLGCCLNVVVCICRTEALIPLLAVS